jgi:hypothetical protein
MKSIRKLLLETPMPPELVVSSLQQSTTRLRWTERLIPTRASLAGQVEGEELVVYRQRGMRGMFGEFRGRLMPRSGGSVVEGEFFAYPAGRLVFMSWFLYAWAALVLVACILDWQGSTSLPFLIIAPGAIAVGYGIRRLYQKNVEAEAELLFEELENRLKGRRV